MIQKNRKIKRGKLYKVSLVGFPMKILSNLSLKCAHKKCLFSQNDMSIIESKI